MLPTSSSRKPSGQRASLPTSAANDPSHIQVLLHVEQLSVASNSSSTGYSELKIPLLLSWVLDIFVLVSSHSPTGSEVDSDWGWRPGGRVLPLDLLVP